MADVGRRYARALVEVVVEMKLDGRRAVAEVYSVADVLNESLELRRIWDNPAVSPEEKRHLLDAISTRLGISRPVRNFVAILIDHRRIGQLPEIARTFEHELNEYLGLAEAEISSARYLTDNEKRDVELQVGKMTGKKVLARYATDAHLLGGIVVRLGSTIYDGSVRGQLLRIKEELSS
jgi:F-type H+-transporting ATPase subunit delta